MGPSVVKALIDTTILIDYVQGYREAATELSRYEEHSVSRITWMEFLVGSKTEEEKRIRESLLRQMALLELSELVARQAVTIRQSKRIALPDAIILATARVHGLVVVTRNHRDFPARDPNVRIPYRV